MEGVGIFGNALTGGIQDRTSAGMTGQNMGFSTPLIVGRFRRGAVNKILNISKQNLKSELGYDPNNPDYMAVEAMLDGSDAVVRVVRIYQTENPEPEISCAGATNRISMRDLSVEITGIEVNGIEYGIYEIDEDLALNLYQTSEGYFVVESYFEGDFSYRCKLITQGEVQSFEYHTSNHNLTASIVDGQLAFCLVNTDE